MLTYLPAAAQKKHKPQEKPWVLLMLVFVWLWPGIINRDLWNPQEPQIYALLQSIFAGNSWIAPVAFGRAYVDNSPIFLWFSALFKNLFSPWLMMGYTAARLTTVLWITIALACMGGAGRELLGRYHGRSVVLLLIGCPGIMIFGHMLGVMPMLFAAIGLFWYAVSLVRRRVGRAGALLGLSWLLAFWAGNLPPLIFLWVITLLLSQHSHWHCREYLLSIIIATVIALPLLPLWPYALWTHNPQAFMQWFHHHAFGVFGGFHHLHFGFSPLDWGKNFLWYALPIWLLALRAIRKQTLSPSTQYLCRAWLAVSLIYLLIQKESDNDQLLWLLPPLAMMAASVLDSLRRGVAAFFNWFGIMTFGLLALFIWLAFFAVNYHIPAAIDTLAIRYNPHFTPDWDYFPMLVALAFTPIWLFAITRKNIRGRQAISNWAAGMTLAWTLIFTLFLPWLDSVKSHRAVVSDMQAALSPELKQALISGEECIASSSYTILSVWNEYGSLPIVPMQNHSTCHYRLSYWPVLNGEPHPTLWYGQRANSERDQYILQRQTHSPIAVY